MPAGRPLELTPEIIRQVAHALPRALYVETVCDQIGVHRETFRRWVKLGGKERRDRDRGRPADPKLELHYELSGVVKKALAQAEMQHAEIISAAGTEVWQAAAWVLERRFPGRWSANRAELRELRKQVAELLARGAPREPHPPGGPPPGPPDDPGPESVE